MLPNPYFSRKATHPSRSYSQCVDSTFRAEKRAGVTYSVACLLPLLHHLCTPPLTLTMFTVEELLAIINLNEAWLRRILGTDEAYINRLVVIGIPRNEAERQSFRRDLMNVLELMRSQNVSASRAARIIGRVPEESSDEDQAEEEVEEEPEEEEDEEEDETTEE